jgi:dUTP pyrophosphatase
LRTILSKNDILNLIRGQQPLISEYLNLDEQLQPNGFDLTLREVAAIQSRGQIANSNTHREIPSLSALSYDSNGYLDLAPGTYVITYNEVVQIPKNLMALGAPRSSLLRCGVTVHMAVWDAGYAGRSQSLMVVFDQYGFRIQKNARVAQLVFFDLGAETEGYTGAYQGENLT